MKIAITGKPFVGKSTIFRAITRATEDNHLIGKPNIGIVKVPDERLEFLSQTFQPKKTTNAELAFADFVGFENLGSALEKNLSVLNQLRTAEALAIVYKLFDVDQKNSPESAIEEWESELLLVDLQVVENRLDNIKRSSKGKKSLPNDKEKDLLLVCKDCIESGKPLRLLALNESEKKLLRDLQMLSIKPVIRVFNIPESLLDKPKEEWPQILQTQPTSSMAVTSICGEIDLEISQLDEMDKKDFMKEMAIEELGSNKLIRTTYNLLGLISFFTVGKDEVKAWTIRKNTKAVKAARVIHSDIEKGFIRAELISYKDFKNCGSMSEGKNKGMVRLEGKNYIVQDGDIINFRFNV